VLSAQTTVVTALVDLQSRELSDRRDIDWYLTRCSGILSTRHSLVVFTEPQLVEPLHEIRHRLAPDSSTQIVGLPFSQFPRTRDVPTITEAFAAGRRPPTASNPVKDTPEYIALGWSKPGLLEVAANHDRFDSKMYWWADIALLGVAQPLEGESLDGLLESSDCELYANVLWETDPYEYEDRGLYYRSTPFSKVAGGIFGVSANNVARFSKDFDREVDQCLASGWPTIDEVILGVVVDQHRGNAELCYGPWETLLSNFREPRMAAWHRLRLLRDCLNRGLNERARMHSEQLNSAWEKGRIELNVEEQQLLRDLRH
jgi:hypothetical protein